MSDGAKLKAIINFIEEHGQVEGDHHRLYCIDQVLRIALGDDYNQWVKDFEAPQEEPGYPGEFWEDEWEIGIAP
jgi:hypothetical protein